MILEFIQSLGPWNWIVFGLVLLGLEILASGTFLLWFGIAAMLVGAVTLIVGTDNSVWIWQVQIIMFLAISLISAYFGRKVMANRGWDSSDKPMLNERGQRLVGKTAVLSEAISGGNGRVKIGDSVWQVSGPDLPKGTKVKIKGSSANVLHVDPVD